MTDIASHSYSEAGLPTALDARLAALREAFATYRRSRETYRRRRAVYLQTLKELRSYRPHELHELRIDSADIEALARQQAGW
jgi:hypothetical protein